MENGQLKYPEWQTPFEDLMLESDPKKLREKLQSLETVIFGRLQRLRQEDSAEQEAINDALSVLRIIKRDKLGFPDWANDA
jgi:hypothetical protein